MCPGSSWNGSEYDSSCTVVMGKYFSILHLFWIVMPCGEKFELFFFLSHFEDVWFLFNVLAPEVIKTMNELSFDFFIVLKDCNLHFIQSHRQKRRKI